VTQGEVFYTTELLARAEGLERGPAGNTSLAAAIAVARELDQDQVVVVSETEYTGAGKSPIAQLEFAESLGVEIVTGPRSLDRPGHRIAIPTALEDLGTTEVPLEQMRASYVRRAVEQAGRPLREDEWEFLAEETAGDVASVRAVESRT
jgi:threonine synthase